MRYATLPALLLAALAALWLGGCSLQPKMTDKHTLYIDTWTKRNNPEVYVEPQKAPPVPVSAQSANPSPSESTNSEQPISIFHRGFPSRSVLLVPSESPISMHFELVVTIW